MDIFIIHSGNDREIVYETCNDLRKSCKNSNFLILDYKNFWKGEAKKKISLAQLVLLFVGEYSHQSPNIRWELNYALNLGKPIFVYKLDDRFVMPITTCKRKKSFIEQSFSLDSQIIEKEKLINIINTYDNDSYLSLINETNLNINTLWDQYKLLADSAEALTNRRQNVNSFYVTTNTAIITIAATAFSLNSDLSTKIIITMALCIPGILLSISWHQMLEAYGIINSSKMKLLGLLEKHLSASLFDSEWVVMSNPYNKRKYISFTDSEKNIPKIFFCVYICIALICIIYLLYRRCW